MIRKLRGQPKSEIYDDDDKTNNILFLKCLLNQVCLLTFTDFFCWKVNLVIALLKTVKIFDNFKRLSTEKNNHK